MQAKSIQFLSGRFTLVLLYLYALNPLKTRNPQMGILANSEDPDEMLHNATFTQSLHCLLRQNQSSEKEMYSILAKF